MLLLAFGECEHPCAAGTWTIWQQLGNNIGNVSPTWLQCCWQKSRDITACHTSNLTVSPTCFQRDVDGRRTGLKIRSSQEGVGSSPTFGTKDLRQIGTPRCDELGNNLAIGLR